MEANKFEKTIKAKFDKRTIAPSASAWERLSVQLDEQPQKTSRGWFFYISVAASILLLVSIGVKFFSSDSEKFEPKEEFVVTSDVKKSIEQEIDKVLQEIPNETVIVKSDEEAKQKKIKQDVKPSIVNKANIASTNKIDKTRSTETLVSISSEENKPQKEVLAQLDKPKDINKAAIIEEDINVESKEIKKSRITINPNDLLYAVTHSSEEVKNYYSRLKIDREDALKSIKKELKKSNIKMNPEIMLAEIEQSVLEEQFDSNFLKTVKEKVSLLASAIANRNYKDNQNYIE